MPSTPETLKLASWNVNGLRAVLKKGAIQDFLANYEPDILCLQEIKAKPEQVDYDFPGYQVFWNPAERPGYSGTAILFSEKFFRFVSPKMYIPAGTDRFAPSGAVLSADQCMTFFANKSIFEENSIAVPEGRVLLLDCNDFYLVNVYTPNSKPDLSRLKLRETEWDPEFLKLLKELEQTKPVVTCGDFNAAHTEIDLARPKDNEFNAGFTKEERKGIDNILNAGFIDTFRALHPDEIRYTWWTWRAGARARNIGWRIDYFFISPSLRKNLKSAGILDSVAGSDHCPVTIELEFNATNAADTTSTPEA